MRVFYAPTVELPAKLDVTRSSHNWTQMPGNWDKLNTHTLYSSTNQWGIPDLPKATTVPKQLVAYNDRYACDHAAADTAIHFFLDDYRFETVWSKPQRPLSRLRRVGTALTPDFSLWQEMPLAMQLWQVYRSRWCGLWMGSNGVDVIPTVSWSTKESYSFAFAGIPDHSIVAVSSVGIRGDDAVKGYRRGLEEMIYKLLPPTVLVYGRSLGEDTFYTDTQFIYFKTRWDM
jgi:Vilmaviridae nuclease